MGELKKGQKRKNKKVDQSDRKYDDEDDGSPKARTIHIIMRDDDDEKGKKISEMQKKNMKKQFLNIMNEFPEDEGGFEDSQAAKLAAQSQK